jgi:tetratricopeptide (TPR) repeat protein
MIFGRFPIRAALLLHADRESRESLSRPESEQVPVCRIGIQSLMVEQFARILLLVDPKAEIFVRNVYLGLSRHAQWTHCAQIAERWAAMGLKLFPRDSQLHLALGIAREMVAFYTAAPAAEATELSPAVLTAGAINRQVELLSRYRGLWEVTRDAYKAALAADSTNVEANLRMGRVLSRLGKAEAAIPHLEAVLADGTEPRLMYLAHLFLGRLLEEKGLFAEAERQYLEALKRDPLSLTTLVALSHLRFVQGDQGAAREMLMAGLKRVRSRTTHDPWAAYQITQRPEGRELLDKLRKEILP